MFLLTNYSLDRYKTLSLTLVFCLLFVVSALAQTEKDRAFPDGARNAENIQQFETPDGSNDVVTKSNAPVKNPNFTVKKESPGVKSGGERDGKKEEISTLSFNLFLYIVDKFKED
jgi:hypothetical protein